MDNSIVTGYQATITVVCRRTYWIIDAAEIVWGCCLSYSGYLHSGNGLKK